MLFAALMLSTGMIWADDATIYLASLKAQADPSSTGFGQVTLTWLDMTGKPFMNSIGVGPSGLNPVNPVGPAATAQMVAGTMFAVDGLETTMMGDPETQIYMTSYVYFHAEAFPENGSYFVDWSYTGTQITRMTSEMNPANPMGDGSEERPYRTPCFKVLPKPENNAVYPGGNIAAVAAYVSAHPNNIYAVFNKYLLSNPEVSSASLEAQDGESADLEVTVEVNGDAASLDLEDFALFLFTNNDAGEWSYDLDEAWNNKEVVSEQRTRLTIPVTYEYHGAGAGVKNTTMTIQMAGESPSTLNVSVSVDALDPSRPEAYWFDGKTEKVSGDLSDMLEVNISSYTNPILRINKPVNDDLTFSGKNFTLDLNGNDAGKITVSSGNVTIAYSKFGGEAKTLTANGGKLILNGGWFDKLIIGANGDVEQNGAVIGDVTNHGKLVTTMGTVENSLESNGTLTLNGGAFYGETAIIISGGTAAINRGNINGTSLGLLVSGGTATVKKLAAIKGAVSAQRVGGTLNVECGKFDGPLSGTINFTSGYFKTEEYGVSKEGKTELLVSAGVEYNEGYRYFLGSSEAAAANGVGVCRIGSVSYAKLEDAIAYANNNPSVENIVIFMTNNYTLPAGYYTLPANATIVVPMSDSQEKEINLTAPRMVFNDVKSSTPYTSVLPFEFRRLTFASGVNMDVFGKIEMTCSQYASNEAYTSQPIGAYGHLVMAEGSHLTLQSGSEVRAWGFVTGKGEMDARRGATVREMFQMGDWKGAMTSVRITGMVKQGEVADALWNMVGSDDSDKKIFPVTQYFIQNIESPVKYHPGAVLSTSAAVSEGLLGMSVSMAATDIAVVGVTGTHQAIFLMDKAADAESTWVRKWYDSENDVQVYDINSAAHIGSMVLDMGEISLLTFGKVPVRLNSAKFDLPLTSNFKIHLLSGLMDFKQNTILLPGAEVEVDKESTVSVAKDSSDPEHTGALYVFDAEDWDEYAYCNEYEGGSMNKGTAYTKTVRYAPSWSGRPTKRSEQVCPPDAAINVHGTFSTASGFVYCSEHGANIFSSNADAGTFIFNESAENTGTRIVNQVRGSSTYENRTFYPAKLKNGVADPAFANTSEAEVGDAYCYTENKWNIMKVDEDDQCFMVDNYGVFYAKPQEYVAVAASKVPDPYDPEYKIIEGNADHTFSDAAGTGRLFILMSNSCQWWEVEKENNLYHCIHPNNDTYYYWDEYAEKWKEKQYTITWKNWDGEIIKTKDMEGDETDSYAVPYGTMAEFLGTNPTRESNIDYTYSFTGWQPALGPVTQDVTYTATYEAQPRMYTIIFQHEGGLEIERQFLTHNEVPVCENVPTKVGHILKWEPAISPVIGDQIYTASWLEEPPTEWDVTFVNNANGVLQATQAVGINDHPAYTGATPVKENADHSTYTSKEYSYTFWGWSAVINGEKQQFAAGAELPCPTAPTTYTAVYTEEARTYTISYYKENGTTLITTEQLQYGATPTPPAVTKENPVTGYTYTLVWKTVNEKGGIQTVMGDASYKPTYIDVLNKYTVTLKCTLPGVCTFAGAGVYDYGTSVNIKAIPAAGYKFVKWQETGNTNADLGAQTISGDITLTAVVDEESAITTYTILWKSEDGSITLETDENQTEGAVTAFDKENPTKTPSDQFTYTFDGWTTEPNGAGTHYDNGSTPAVSGDATYYAHFNSAVNQYTVTLNCNIPGTCTFTGAGTYDYGTSVNIKAIPAAGYEFVKWQETEDTNADLGPQTITGNITLTAVVAEEVAFENLEVGINAPAVTINVPTDYMDVVINSDGITSSSQIVNANNITLHGNADFVLHQSFAARKWYCVAVPWRVEVNGGIFIGESSTPAVLGNDIEIVYYDGAVRATQGKVDECWVLMRNLSEKILEPGRAYMIELYNVSAEKLTFRMKNGESILTTATAVQRHDQTTGYAIDGGWNAIANPSLFHAFVNAGSTGAAAQRYNAALEQFDWFNLSDHKLVVGEPIYVQAPADKTITVSYDGDYAAAPRRAKASVNTEYEVSLSSEGAAAYADHLSIGLNEGKEQNEYIIGQDLAKFGVGTKVAQMWIDRYNSKLCINAVAPEGEATNFPMGLFAPNSGEYTFAIEREVATEEVDLYLTYGGEAIYNLSNGAYTVNLQKGVDMHYGLRISAKAPQVSTGIDEAVVNGKEATAIKVLVGNQVFIVRGNKVYTIDGQLVK